MFSAKSSFRPVPLYVNAISTTDEPFVLDQSELNLTEYPSPEYDFHDDVLDVELFSLMNYLLKNYPSKSYF